MATPKSHPKCGKTVKVRFSVGYWSKKNVFENVAHQVGWTKTLGKWYRTAFVSSFFILLLLLQQTHTVKHKHDSYRLPQCALLYLDFRGWEFVCSPASLWGVLVLSVQVDCTHLALLQEGHQNQPIAHHRWGWHHHTSCHYSKQTKQLVRWLFSFLPYDYM